MLCQPVAVATISGRNFYFGLHKTEPDLSPKARDQMHVIACRVSRFKDKSDTILMHLFDLCRLAGTLLVGIGEFVVVVVVRVSLVGGVHESTYEYRRMKMEKHGQGRERGKSRN